MPQSRYLQQHSCEPTFFWTQSILDTAFRMADSERFFSKGWRKFEKKTGLRNSRLYWAAGATYVVCMPDL